MPNQYTKFKAASQHPESREFRWKEFPVKKVSQPGTENKTHFKSSTSVTQRRRSKQKSLSQSPISSPEQIQLNRQVPPKELLENFGTWGPSDTLLQYLPSGGLRIDPFRAYPVNPTRAELTVLDYYLHMLAPSGKHNYHVARKQPLRHVDPHINLLLPYVMQEPPLFDSMLATCQAAILLSCGDPAYGDRFFVEHRSRAMTALRERLDVIDTTTILSVSMLLTCDYMTGDLEAVIGHMKALHRMTTMKGPLSTATKWDRFVKAGVVAYMSIGYMTTGVAIDEKFAAHPLNRSVDVLLPLTYPSIPLSPAMCVKWAELPPGFSELNLSGQLSTQLLEIMFALGDVDDNRQAEFIREHAQLFPIQAALNRFSQHAQVTTFERYIAAGLLAFTFQYPRLHTPNLFHDPPMYGFIRLFSTPYRPATQAERDILIWIYVVVEAILSSRATRLPGGRQIFLQATNRFHEMRDWNTLEPILKRFFYTSQTLDHWQFCHNMIFQTLSIDEALSMPPMTNSPSSIDLDGAGEAPLLCPFTGRSSATLSKRTKKDATMPGISLLGHPRMPSHSPESRGFDHSMFLQQMVA